MIHLLLVLSFAVAWRAGGWDKGRPGKWFTQGWGGWRDLCLPAAIGLAHAYVYQNLVLGSLMIISCSIIRMGDGNWSPEDDPKPSLLGALTHDRTGILTKGLHGLICGFVAPLPRMIIVGGDIWHYLIFAVGFGLVSALLRMTAQVWIDEPGRGAWFSGILLI